MRTILKYLASGILWLLGYRDGSEKLKQAEKLVKAEKQLKWEEKRVEQIYKPISPNTLQIVYRCTKRVNNSYRNSIETNTYRNIKTLSRATEIVNKRNRNTIVSATWNPAHGETPVTLI